VRVQSIRLSYFAAGIRKWTRSDCGKRRDSLKKANTIDG